jgi:hypothetical protein
MYISLRSDIHQKQKVVIEKTRTDIDWDLLPTSISQILERDGYSNIH